MGAIKFFNGGQSITELMVFGRYNLGTINTNYTMSVLPGNVYNSNTLSAEFGNKYPFFSNTGAWSGYYFSRFSHLNNSKYMYKASSDATHDKTLYTFHNVVADVSVLADSLYNGVKQVSLSLANNGNEAVTVKSLQRSNSCQFASGASSTSGNEGFYLDWAYYLDESEWITLEAGETKAITLTITMADLTQ